MTKQLKKLREKAGLTQTDVASFLGVSYENYNRLENGKTDFRLSTMERLAKLFGCAIEDLIADHSGKKVEVRAYVEAGTWSDHPEWQEDDRYEITVPDTKEMQRLNLIGAETRGPSMNKVYPEGTVIVIATDREMTNTLEPGKRYVVQRRSVDGLHEQTVKTLMKDDDGKFWLMPESTDPRHQAPIQLGGSDGDSIHILGRVVYALRRED